MNVPFYSHPSTRNDEWVIKEALRGYRKGYYVEAGAFDGLTDSNTLTLERYFEWHGLLIEPHPELVPQMIANRPGNAICTKALGVSGMATGTLLLGGQWSGLQELMTRKFVEQHQQRTNPGIEVKVITLHEALEVTGAPGVIDYLSMDTEGSELPILLDYFLTTPASQRRVFKCISVEYQYDATILESLNVLMDQYGYDFVRLSGWDAFYTQR